MKKKIQEIKQKPHAERKKIATLAAGVTTGIIVIIWLILRFTVIAPQERNPVFDQQTLETFVEQTSKSFQSLEETFSQEKDTFTDIQDKFEEQGGLSDNPTEQDASEELINDTQE